MEIRYIELPKKSDERGSLSFMESHKQIPFDIKRVYYIYDLKNDKNIRWEHAHHETEQVIFCIHGSVILWFDDGQEKKEIKMTEPNIGVYIPINMWHYMKDFSDWCILLVVASQHYDEKDYIRNYADFLQSIKK
ncbi:MAG: sugar isomerase [uncultured bacterium (gcode 4)]|uniref:Sugar isomerase n=1 Tax=uncultured bacterium (gcode 4) TaxID=1234023 RepID=K1X3Z3_9BACT|nr:MAG: sugar isomerase [uncultured bacterium (gcode 4)]